MSSRRDLYRLAMERLAKEGERLSPPLPTAETEARMIDAVGAAIATRGRARRRRRLAVAVGSATLVVTVAAALVLLVRRPAAVTVAVTPPVSAPSESARPQRGEPKGVEATLEGSISQLVRGAPATAGSTAVRSGDRILAGPTDRAALVLSTGTRVAVASGAELEVDALGATQIFRLRRGSTDLTVAKLGLGERFLVRTDDAEIEVRGTAFRVETSSERCSGSLTRVRVFEGRVVVRAEGKEHAVEPGGFWPVACESPASLGTGLPPSSPPPAPAHLGSPARVASGRRPAVALSGSSAPAPPAEEPRSAEGSAVTAGGKAAPPTASELAEQNRVYGDALSARQRGATAEALAGFDAFLARYPRAALAESAAVERMRLLSRNDPARARLAARDYLVRWPHGFAREEATALLDAR